MNLNKEIESFSKNKRELLFLILEKNAKSDSFADRIVRRGRVNGELSFAQQRLWFLHKLKPSDATYNTPAGLRIKGNLNFEILTKIFNFLVFRHETLRLVFKEQKGQIFQHVQKPFDTEIIRTDFRENVTQTKSKEVYNSVLMDIQIPFDLENGPLFRVHLYQLEVDEHILLLNMHHIISDGWSLGVIIQEIVTLYKDFLNNKTPSLPKLEIQYPDYAIWERKMIESQKWQNQLSHWKKVLSEKVSYLKLPGDKNANGNNSNDVETSSILLNTDLVNAIKRVCTDEHITLYIYLLTCFQVLLYLYTGNKDIAIGSPVANRNRSEVEGLIGCFINPLLMRIKLDGSEDFSDLLKKNRQIVLDAFDNQEVPFEQVLKSINYGQKRNQGRLFNIWFVLQNAPLKKIKIKGLEFFNYKIPRISSQFDLAMNISEADTGIHCAIDYSTSLFTSESIRKTLDNYKLILTLVSESTSLKIDEIPIEDPNQSVSSKALLQSEEDDFSF